MDMDSVGTNDATADFVVSSSKTDVTKVKSLMQEVRASVYPIFLLVVLCEVFLLIIWVLAQVAPYRQAHGSLIEWNGRIIGSSLTVRSFQGERYFHFGAEIPADAVTASGSGLDRQSSVRNAELQAPHVARTRGIPGEQVKKSILESTESPQLGLPGDPAVDVPKLNLALDVLEAGR
jgi:K+-transporting ATPase c subunit